MNTLQTLVLTELQPRTMDKLMRRELLISRYAAILKQLSGSSKLRPPSLGHLLGGLRLLGEGTHERSDRYVEKVMGHYRGIIKLLQIMGEHK